MAATRDFRFGVNLVSVGDRRQWAEKCRLAERLGFDVLLVPDHLGAPAPFPALIAAAEVTERPRLGTFVLNAGFWNPTLLAREVDTVGRLTGGRLELGLGTGYIRAEFESAGLPWESPGRRVDRVAGIVQALAATADRPPLLLAGQGDRMLRLAAEHADTVAFTGAKLVPGSRTGELRLVNAAELDERVAFFTAAAGDRDAEIERNILVQRVVVTDDRRGEVERLRAEYGVDYLTVDDLLELPTLLIGTVEQIVAQLWAARERFGLSYVCVLEPSMAQLAPVIEQIRQVSTAR